MLRVHFINFVCLMKNTKLPRLTCTNKINYYDKYVTII